MFVYEQINYNKFNMLLLFISFSTITHVQIATKGQKRYKTIVENPLFVPYIKEIRKFNIQSKKELLPLYVFSMIYGMYKTIVCVFGRRLKRNGSRFNGSMLRRPDFTYRRSKEIIKISWVIHHRGITYH